MRTIGLTVCSPGNAGVQHCRRFTKYQSLYPHRTAGALYSALYARSFKSASRLRRRKQRLIFSAKQPRLFNKHVKYQAQKSLTYQGRIHIAIAGVSTALPVKRWTAVFFYWSLHAKAVYSFSTAGASRHQVRHYNGSSVCTFHGGYQWLACILPINSPGACISFKVY